MHDHPAHLHTGGHSHAHGQLPPAGTAPAPSLLLLSFTQRLAGAAGLLALLWAAVFWALV